MGLTEQYIHQQVSKFDYERWRAQLETHVRNSNEDDDAEMDFGPTVGPQCQQSKVISSAGVARSMATQGVTTFDDVGSELG